MSASEHAMLHHIEDRGYKLERTCCYTCSVFFEHSAREPRKYCSTKCAEKDRATFLIGREDLYQLVWTKPTVEVGKILGVSDVAVAKKCKKLKVPKPPRGYWAKAHAGKKVTIIPLD